MKRCFAVLLLIYAQQSAGVVSQFACDNVIFSGLTFKKEKKVQVCLSGPGLSYTFGAIDKDTPELDVRVTPRDAEWVNYREQVRDMTLPEGKEAIIQGQGITLHHGQYTYQLFVGANGETHHETLKIYRQHKRLEKIKLHPDTIYTRIGDYLEEEYDIPRTHNKMW